MSEKIVVTGATGTLGRMLISRLPNPAEVTAIGRTSWIGEREVDFRAIDLSTPKGLEAALDGASVIIHCAGAGQGDDILTANLIKAISPSHAPHLLYISVVGADRVPVRGRMDTAMFGYYAAKRRSELLIQNSGYDFTILRATQFHELMFKMGAAMSKMPFVPVPGGIRFQTVAASEVADRMVELARSEPAGFVPNLAGPEVHALRDIMSGYLAANALRKPIISVPIFTRASRALKDGANLDISRAVGVQTWGDAVQRHAARSRSAQ